MSPTVWRATRRLVPWSLSVVIFAGVLLSQDGPPPGTAGAEETRAVLASLADTPWPKYRKDLTHTGRSPFSSPGSKQVKWTFATGKRDAAGGIETDPVIGPDGTVILGANNGILYALDPETGDIRWVFPTGFDTFAIYSTPFIDRQGIVYFGAKDGHVYALRPPRGGILAEVVWSLHLGTTIETSPTVTPDGTIVIGADDWAYYGIAPPRGTVGPRVKWRFQTQGTLIASPAVDAGGTVYGASMDGTVYALAPPTDSGGSVTVRWRFRSGARDAAGGFENAPAIDDQGTLYIGGNDGILYALDSETGKTRWTFDGVARSGYRTYAIFSSVAVAADRTIYFGGKDGVLYALRERRGLFATGPEVLWRYKLGPGIQSSPLLAADGTVYLGDEGGTLHAVRPPEAGEWAKPLWTFATKGALISSPALGADGSLYTASMDGTVYAFHDAKKGQSSAGPLSGTWYGTYRDRGGTGQITLVLVQRSGEIHGLWRLTGGAYGALEGTVTGDRGLFTARAAAKRCPGTGEGTVRIDGDALRGSYRGADCRGTMDGGTFEVRR